MLPTSLAVYRNAIGHFDEAIDPRGEVRSAWSSVVDDLLTRTPAEFAALTRTADRFLLTAGATHAGTDGGIAEAWHLDPVPLVYDATEWAILSAGLAQRARLFDALLADVYGPRRLVHAGLLPVELVQAAGLQLAAIGWSPPGPRLALYSADVVRDARGTFQVLRDHTDAPGGAGRALLNRAVAGRVLPDLLRRLRVAPVRPWYVELRAALATLAPTGAQRPRIVVLGPRADDPDYAEVAYLSTQLGYNLVDIDDLTVRGGRVHLRSIGGLEPIDVVFRSLPDTSVDPLEATPPTGGVAGFTEAAREGHLGVGNSLGSSTASALALAPFLESVCDALLGEHLLLPSVETRWCGQSSTAAMVIAELDTYVLHDVARHGPASSAFGWALSDDERARWTHRLRTTPWTVVAQPRLELATSPSAYGGMLAPSTTVLRAFVANGPGGPRVLPGGLGRVVRPDIPVVDQRSTATKDVWIVADPAPSPTSTTSERRVDVGLAQVDLRESLPSRAAEALFWVGRNAERAELVARAALVSSSMLRQDADLAEAPAGTWAAAAVGVMAALSGRVDGVIPAGPNALDAAIGDALGARAGGLADSLGQLQRTAAGIHEFLSAGTWRVLAALGVVRSRLVESGPSWSSWTGADPASELDTAVIALAAFAGLAQESVVRGPSWRFLDLGRRLERAQLLLAALTAGLSSADRSRDGSVDGPIGELLLASCESLVAYRRRYRSDVRFPELVELLVVDDTNPRSLAFQLDRAVEHLTGLPERAGRQDCLAIVTRATTAALDLRLRGRGDLASFTARLVGVRELVAGLADAVTRCWFSGVDIRRGGTAQLPPLGAIGLGADR